MEFSDGVGQCVTKMDFSDVEFRKLSGPWPSNDPGGFLVDQARIIFLLFRTMTIVGLDAVLWL